MADIKSNSEVKVSSIEKGEISDVKNSIETKAEQKGFWTKKNVIILVSTFCIFIAIVVLTIFFIMDLDFANLIASISRGFGNQLGWLWFILLFAYIPIKILSCVATVLVRLNQMKVKVSFWNKTLFALTTSFLAAVTPSSFVTDPYLLFWLKTCGLSTSDAAALTFSNSFLWVFCRLAITLPSFIWMCTYYDAIIATTNGLVAFWFSVGGILIVVLGVPFQWALGFSKHFHYYLSRAFNTVKKWIRMSYHTKEETHQKYLDRSILKTKYVWLLKDWKRTSLVCVLTVSFEFIWYSEIYFAMQFLSPQGTEILFWNVFSIANVATTANQFIPIPGGEGTIQYWMLTFLSVPELNGTDMSGADLSDLVNNSVLVWRVFSAYIPAIIGMIGFGTLTGIQLTKVKKKQKLFGEENSK